jgi:hypothetical protein
MTLLKQYLQAPDANALFIAVIVYVLQLHLMCTFDRMTTVFRLLFHITGWVALSWLQHWILHELIHDNVQLPFYTNMEWGVFLGTTSCLPIFGYLFFIHLQHHLFEGISRSDPHMSTEIAFALCRQVHNWHVVQCSIVVQVMFNIGVIYIMGINSLFDFAFLSAIALVTSDAYHIYSNPYKLWSYNTSYRQDHYMHPKVPFLKLPLLPYCSMY